MLLLPPPPTPPCMHPRGLAVRPSSHRRQGTVAAARQVPAQHLQSCLAHHVYLVQHWRRNLQQAYAPSSTTLRAQGMAQRCTAPACVMLASWEHNALMSSRNTPHAARVISRPALTITTPCTALNTCMHARAAHQTRSRPAAAAANLCHAQPAPSSAAACPDLTPPATARATLAILAPSAAARQRQASAA